MLLKMPTGLPLTDTFARAPVITFAGMVLFSLKLVACGLRGLRDLADQEADGDEVDGTCQLDFEADHHGRATNLHHEVLEALGSIVRGGDKLQAHEIRHDAVKVGLGDASADVCHRLADECSLHARSGTQ